MKNVRSQSEFNAIFKSLESQGFAYCTNQDQMLRQRIHGLIRAENKHNLTLKMNEITRKLNLFNIDSFAEMKTAIKKHFKQFSVNDKLNQCLGEVQVQSGETIRQNDYDDEQKKQKFNAYFAGTGFNWDKANELENCWFELKDVSKNYIKLSFDHRDELEYILKTVLEISDFKIPYRIIDKWEFGKKYFHENMDFVFYQNGFIKIQHKNIDKLKKLFAEKDAKFKTYVYKF